MRDQGLGLVAAAAGADDADKPALVQDGAPVTYAELRPGRTRLAHGLRARGVAPG